MMDERNTDLLDEADLHRVAIVHTLCTQRTGVWSAKSGFTQAGYNKHGVPVSNDTWLLLVKR